jgi:hypothetical protein
MILLHASAYIGHLQGDVQQRKAYWLIMLHMRSFFFLHGTAAQRGLWPPHSRGFRDHTYDAPQSVGLLWTIYQSVAETTT